MNTTAEDVQLTGNERYRRQVLFALGLIWGLTALGLVVSPPDANPNIPHERLPSEIRAAFWAIPAVVALVGVWWRRFDATAWALLCVPPLERGVSFAWAWWASVNPWSQSPGFPNGWRSVLVYGAIIFLINRCAVGLDRVRVKRTERGADERVEHVHSGRPVAGDGSRDGVRFRADPPAVEGPDQGPVGDDDPAERGRAVRESPRGSGPDDRATESGSGDRPAGDSGTTL